MALSWIPDGWHKLWLCSWSNEVCSGESSHQHLQGVECENRLQDVTAQLINLHRASVQFHKGVDCAVMSHMSLFFSIGMAAAAASTPKC